MTVLIIGSGGREHALAWKIKQSPLVHRLLCAPGNAGIGELAELVPLVASDVDGLVNFAVERRVDLTVVGPEQPLTLGIVDAFQSRGLTVFGPSKAAAALEGSKAFAKDFMKRHGIPTAEFQIFSKDQIFDAERYVNSLPLPVVVKADGLAGGKGVTVCETREHAVDVIRAMMNDRMFGDAGSKIVVEEFLEGEEASVFAVTDGRFAVLLPSAQDHKRILDNDQGKNTGGMGAYAPAPVVTRDVLQDVQEKIVVPALRGMAAEGHPYTGCLYAGLMITAGGPKVVEFNCRFGDPETQVVLPLIESDIVPLLLGAARGNLEGLTLRPHDRSAVCVVIASGGYPDAYQTGKPIIGLENIAQSDDVIVFHSGTKRVKNVLETSGGRVLGITAVGAASELERTIDRAYGVVKSITFDGAYYRSDIGKKGVKRLRDLHKLEAS